jgi:hypothetical protein
MTYNYATFFRLYASAPHLGRAIMDVVAESMRWAGLNAFVKACDLPLPVAELAQLLGFSPRSGVSAGKAAESEDKPLPGCMRAHLVGDAAAAATSEEGTTDCAAWLRDHGAVVVEKGTWGSVLWGLKRGRISLIRRCPSSPSQLEIAQGGTVLRCCASTFKCCRLRLAIARYWWNLAQDLLFSRTAMT